MIGRVRHSAARESPEERIPLAPYQGRGRYPAHERGRVCLPLGPGASGSAGSTLSKAALLRLPESVNKHTNKQKAAAAVEMGRCGNEQKIFLTVNGQNPRGAFSAQ